MSLFEKLKNKRSSLQEKKDDGIKKPTKKANKEVFDVTGKSAARDAKKYSSGEYPKIGGGSRIGSKSKGPGAETGAKVNLNPTSGSKSKGTTPVKVNITKPVKQSEISKQAKKFTKKINKRNINRPEGIIGDTYVSTTKKGKIRSAKKVNPTLKKSISQVKADIEFKQGLQKSGASGDISDTAPKKIRDYVTKKREARATKLGTPDPFTDKTKFSQKDFEKSLKKKYPNPPKTPSQPIVGGGGGPGTKPPSSNKFTRSFEKPSDPFAGRYDTPGRIKIKAMDKKAFKKTQPSDILKDPELSKTYGTKSFTDFSKKIKKFKKDLSKTASITPTVGVKQADVSRRAKKFSQNISNKVKLNKVQMRGGATNIPAGPTSPPKKYNIPADDRPGKLAQGRDFPSKRSYDAKLEKQIKTLRGKAANLRAAKMQASGEKIPGLRKTGLFSGKNVSSETRKKLAARQAERTRTADALERSLKRQGTKGPTSMLPVVSGKGADEKMPGMGGKTYKQFYKDANVGAKQPPKVKSTPKPPPVNNTVNDTVKNVYKKSKVTSNYTGGFRNTAAFDKRVARMSRGFGGNRGKRALAGKILKFAKNNPKTAIIGTGLALGAAYFGKQAFNRRNDLKSSDIRQTTKISDPSGKPIRFQYGDKKNPASYKLSKNQLGKFRTGEYSVKDTRTNKKINLDQKIKTSAFTKQYQDAQKGTGFLGRQTDADKAFVRKYKKATGKVALK